jgi:group II intron reverse transcriptase/maturase
MTWVRLLQRRLYSSAKADPQRTFGVLYDKVCDFAVLYEAWLRVSANGGVAGVDGRSIEQIRESGVVEFLKELQQELREERYRPEKIRRTYIPKPDGRQRPLGIPTIKDRVAQMAVKLVIEPLFEADFLDCSHGFRPRRSAHRAVREIERAWRVGLRWVVDVDLQSYFDTIPHGRLLQLVRRRVHDPRIMGLIRSWLKAGVLEAGTTNYPEAGTPQGGVLSPLLANIYLHEVDRRWQRQGPRVQLVRYADDMVLLCVNGADARREHAQLQAVMESMGLRLNAAKTRVVAVREGFDFVGFSFRRGQYWRDGKQREALIKVPRARAIKSAMANIKQAVKAVPLGEAVPVAVQTVNRRLRGWVNYFRISNARATVKRLVWHSTRQLRLFLRRGYQRKGSQYSQRWPDAYFHDHLGLYRVDELLRKKVAQC